MKIAHANLPSQYGNFIIYAYPEIKGLGTVVLTTPKLNPDRPVLVRVHSECMTGDVFDSLKCDCGQQKEESLKMITRSGNGMMIYLRQEGRGIGLYEKIKAYKLQEEGYDTHEANIKLGHKPDQRDYSILKEVFKYFKIKEINLITNNPSKISDIAKFGVKVLARVPIVIEPNKHNKKYLDIKKTKFNNFFDRSQNNYFFGIHGIDSTNQLMKIGSFMDGKKKDPLLKICISDNTLVHNSLSDSSVLDNNKRIFKTAEGYDGFVPILHFSFRDSLNPIDDLKKIKQVMPYVKYVQLNDIQDNDLNILKFATKHFIVDFPLTNKNFDHLISDKSFIQLVIKQKIFVVLDNSGGRGIREKIAVYKEKISHCLNVGANNIILAGGFGPDYLESYFQMKDYFKINFSIDAESGLRSNGKFNIKKAEKYLSKLLQ